MNSQLGIQLLDKLLKQEKIDPSWEDFLRDLLGDPSFFSVLQQLTTDKKEGKNYFPKLDEAFNVFKYCKKDNLKVVLLGQDPYPQPGIATGIAFANSDLQEELSPSLSVIVEELEGTIEGFNSFRFFQNTDLKHWCNQGVMPLNRALTVRKYEPNSHALAWNEFTEKLLKKLNDEHENLVFVFMGKAAQKYWSCIDKKKHFKRKCAHPAADTYSDQRLFRGSKVFSYIDDRLEKLYGTTISWDE